MRRARSPKVIAGGGRPEYEREDDMTGKEIYEKLCEYLKTLDCPDWAKAELKEAVDMGITDGERPFELTPRFQTAIMVKRAAKK